MKIKTIFNDGGDINIETYLTKMGIGDVNKYLNPSPHVLDSCYVYKNIRECVNTIKYTILMKSRVCIVCDCDTDGICSSFIMYDYLKRCDKGIKVKLLIQDGKQRGIESDSIRQQIKDFQPDLVIIPDAGTNSAPYEDEIVDICPVVCIDHHLADDDVAKRFIIVNNTMNDLDCNTELSGTGVVFKVLQAVDKERDTKYSNRYIDLVGLSIVSDCMDIRTYENRWFVKYILDKDNISNPFIGEMFDTLLGDTYTQKDIAFKIVPLINSVIRCGSKEEIQKLYFALMGRDIEDTIKMCQKCHSMQIDIVNEWLDKCDVDIQEQSENNITIITNDGIPKTFSGLLAGKISGLTNKPCVVGKVIDGEIKGSYRGYVPLGELDKLDSVTYAKGHDFAFGIGIDVTRVKDFINAVNKMDVGAVRSVLCSYKADKVPKALFSMFADYDDVWGQELPSPQFYVHDIHVNSSDIRELGNGTTLKFSIDGYDVLFFNISKAKKEQFYLEESKDLTLNIVGKLGVNVWRGKRTNQIIVEDYEVKLHTNTFDDLM